MEAKLLIVDDEEDIRFSLKDYFEREGFFVAVAEDGRKALQALYEVEPDLIILDILLPFVNGLDVCREIRRHTESSISIIMISGSKKDMVDEVVGLELGADVYLTKPVPTPVLLAQVRALLRRRKAEDKQRTNEGWLQIDDYLRIHFDKRKVEAGGHEVHLTQLEFDLLIYLVQNHGNPCGRSDLIDKVWGYEAGGDISDNAVNTCIAKLRLKIERDQDHPQYILSVHGIGYRFKEF